MSRYLSSTTDLYEALSDAYGDRFSEVVKRNLSVSLSSAGYSPWDIPSEVVDILEGVSVDGYRQMLSNRPEYNIFYHNGYCFLLNPVED